MLQETTQEYVGSPPPGAKAMVAVAEQVSCHGGKTCQVPCSSLPTLPGADRRAGDNPRSFCKHQVMVAQHRQHQNNAGKEGALTTTITQVDSFWRKCRWLSLAGLYFRPDQSGAQESQSDIWMSPQGSFMSLGSLSQP